MLYLVIIHLQFFYLANSYVCCRYFIKRSKSSKSLSYTLKNVSFLVQISKAKKHCIGETKCFQKLSIVLSPYSSVLASLRIYVFKIYFKLESLSQLSKIGITKLKAYLRKKELLIKKKLGN